MDLCDVEAAVLTRDLDLTKRIVKDFLEKHDLSCQLDVLCRLASVVENAFPTEHDLLDIVLAGAVIHGDSSDEVAYDEAWGKWACNRIARDDPTNECLTLSASPWSKLMVAAMTNAGARALLEMRRLMVPQIAMSDNEILMHRKMFEEATMWLIENEDDYRDSSLLTPNVILPIMAKMGGYALTYHEGNNAHLFSLQAQVYKILLNIAGCPVGRQLYTRSDSPNVRVGFLTRWIGNHSVGKILCGLLQNLVRFPDLDLYVYTIEQSTKDDMGSILFDALEGEKRVRMPKPGLYNWLDAILEDKLDVLVFVDPIMDIHTYFLGFFRLAPVQISTWGHPDTTGLADMDYYVSSELFEEAGAAVNYTEKLIRMKSLGICYRSIENFLPLCRSFGESLETLLSREGKEQHRDMFQLPKAARIYGIPGSTLKMSPTMDRIIKGILDKDKEGLIVMLSGKNQDMLDCFIQRASKILTEDDQHRLIILPGLSDVMDFVRLMHAMDVVLDTMPFGGCITTYECFAAGAKCVVTKPGTKLYGRFTFGMYKAMGARLALENLVADSEEMYIDKAVAIAKDLEMRSRCEQEIRSGLPRILDDQSSVLEWYSLLKSFGQGVQQSQ
jgi:predicted O-linked N-acetylglucosamine transferase (SPINDLY family)